MTSSGTSARVITFASGLDSKVLDQARDVASLPFIYPHVALMPDAHFGLGSAVGTVFGTQGAVIPAAVGVDIGCGMIGVRTQFVAADLAARDLTRLRGRLERVIPLSPGNYNKRVARESADQRVRELQELADDTGVDLSHSPKWKVQLGSLGGGNHFIELCLDEQDRVWMFLHSGSRGVGNKIAQKHIKVARAECAGLDLPNNDVAFLTEGTATFGQYLCELQWAQRFAWLNREEMMDRFSDELSALMGAAVVEDQRINCHHNYTVQEEHYGETVWLTRKGAILAADGVPALIPGSMGTVSYVVEGKGNVEALRSAPHGAGRRFSRTEAKKRFTAADLDQRMEGIVYRPGKEWVDEIPDAYKDIDQVMDDARELVTVKHKLRQVLNVKGT
ncbi:RtcB family protein [Corynebacterium cystitidis]|uniref:3'-phosphate/5'-hydroxy nucleic acid ligase n=1 Tax=Corynebacterium cystitidis DSM 20524 TaxID=1121357 RepID=A0A1H9QKX3_9CORY|nr:RtcB family protein [Corynebacterium cystitidis]WJY81734.1 RNA-splicing ligase RtcB [Corynebacterium cystitidis DSM 20524]SER61094.1 tRNA-splicing ligase RtcB [Corynebacterium cystitidis DSM 20524]SNV84254.1 RNA-splicing ligase RtcB [Corynebacterium cystitidis]